MKNIFQENVCKVTAPDEPEPIVFYVFSKFI